jgi:hypothetical protein
MLPGLAPGVAGEFDPYWSSVHALFSFDGPSVLTNSGPVNNAYTARGTLALSTTQKRFGPSSAYCDGGGASFYSTNAVSLPGDYTIETSFFPTASAVGTLIDLRANDTDASNAPAASLLANRTISLWIANATRFTSVDTYALNTWHKLTVQRSAGVISALVNGQSIGSYSGPGSLTGKYIVCAATSSGAANRFTGYIDEFRATLGVARYAGNYTPRDRPFPRR